MDGGRQPCVVKDFEGAEAVLRERASAVVGDKAEGEERGAEEERDRWLE